MPSDRRMDPKRKKLLVTLLKLVVAAAVFTYIGREIAHKQNIDALRERVANLSWGWVAVAAAIQALAIGCSIVRWQLLLRGQGVRAPLSHLVSAFMSGRFLSAVSPGGWTGLDAYRIFDIASRTKKNARAVATVGIDKLLGQAALGSVIVVAATAFGVPYLGVAKIGMLAAAFGALIVTIFALLLRPTLFRSAASRLPAKVRTRLQTMVDAVSAYQGKGRLLLGAFALSWGTHLFTNLITVAAAFALGLPVSPGAVFFVSTMMVLATLLPISPNGMGLREAAAVYLFGQVGIGAGEAVLVPLLYFAIDMAFSALGGIFLLLPKREPEIVIEDAEREDRVNAEIPLAPAETWPKLARGTSLGFGAGLLAGLLVGLTEAGVIIASSGGRAEHTVLAYGAVVYALLLGLGGAVGGLILAWSGRLMQREALKESSAYGLWLGLLVAAPTFALGAFRVRRDVYRELLVWASGKGALVLLGCAAACFVLFALLAFVFSRLTRARAGAWLLRAWGTPAFVAVAIAGVLAYVVAMKPAPLAEAHRDRPAAPAQAGPIIFVVVDTLRADRLPSYGYASGRTPHLDAFARDALRFENAFANASWTRPSFATLLTGSYPSRHATMGKSDSLPEALVTMPEALQAAGYATSGIVTNYNVAPFFHFDQGFDRFAYLEPNFVLGADDTAAKLLLIQFARQMYEKLEEKALGGTPPGRAYQDGVAVNRAAFADLDGFARPENASAPFFLFVAYMDPHDPYYPHPYGSAAGYSRAAHPTPALDEAPRLSALYDGEVTFWDTQFGALVADLRRRNLYENSTIIVTGDHGEEFGEHGGFWHGTTLYDEEVRVPLFVKLPFNQRGGQVRTEWVQHVDLMPTVLRLAGVEVPAGVQGQDIFDRAVNRDEAFAEESHEGNVLQSLRLRRGGSELKLITANEGNPRGLETTELYRLDVDGHERVNLAEELPWETSHARAQLTSFGTRAQQGRVAGEQVSMTAGGADRLRALGYAGGSERPPSTPAPDAGTRTP
jgi:uncharacterized protein (TIRG00374 family)